jgi:hypothetical protein
MPEAGKPGHETRDLDPALVTWFALGLVIAVAAFFLLTAALFRLFRRAQPSPSPPSRIEFHPRMLAPSPRLQANNTTDLANYQIAENEKLNSYDWIDRDKGIIRIPIERAMDLIAQRGLPTRGPGTQNSSGKTPEQMVQERANTK